MTHLRIGNKVNWLDSKTGSTPKEVTIVGDGMKGGEVVYDLDNGHWAYESQLTNRAMDKALADAAALGEEWKENGGSPWGTVLKIAGYPR
jgi:lysine/ornithine N-monooxygenase